MFQIKEEHMLVSEEQLKQMEAMGSDVSMYREIKKKADAFSITICEKLGEIAKTPRNEKVAKAICKPVYFLDMILKRKAHIEAAINAPLVYGCIVQAHNSLFQVDYTGNNYNIPAVLVFAADEKHHTDAELLKQIANKLFNYKKIASEQRGNSENVPDDCRDIIKNLLDTRSTFCLPVPESLSGDAKVWCATSLIADAKYIPYKRAPKDRLLPFIMKTLPCKNRKGADLLIVSGNLYRENH